MNKIEQLFHEYLNPNNLNPEEAGKALLAQFCSSIDLLFTIIQKEPNLTKHCVIFLKLVLESTLNDMNDEEAQNVFIFVTMILIPNILPQDPNYLSPTIFEIFTLVSRKTGIGIDWLNEYIKKLNDPCFLPFILVYLNNIDPSLIDIEFSCNIISLSLDTREPLLIKLSFRLFVILCNNFPQSSVFQMFCERFISIATETQSPAVWNILSDFSIYDFAVPFKNIALSVISNNSIEQEVRVCAFDFFICRIDSSNLKEIPQLLNYLIEFQMINLNEYDSIDLSLFILYQEALQIPEIRSDTFELIKSCSFQLLGLETPIHQVIGLYSLYFLIDNSKEMGLNLIEYIPKDLSNFHVFLSSGNPRIIEAVFDVLKVLVGKPLGSHFKYELIFNDVIELFLSPNDNTRNQAAIFSYKYLHSHFVTTFWIFRKFFTILHLVKYSELPIYLQILADSILPNIVSVTDSELDSLVELTTEILNSEREEEVKISAASLGCSLIQKDFDLAEKIGNRSIFCAFMAITEQDQMIKETMSKCLILFIKCTFGCFNQQFRIYYPKLLDCSISNNSLSLNSEPILLAEMIRWDWELPDKEKFLSLLMTTIFDNEKPNEEQYKIACLCLSRLITKFPINTQIEITVKIGQIIFNQPYYSLIPSNILLLDAMLKRKNPDENRIQIAQIVSTFFRPFSDDILKPYIGSLCRLMIHVIRSIGSNVPDNLKQFCYQLFEKNIQSPLYYNHFNFFLISVCIKYSVVENDTVNSIIESAFIQLSGELTNLNASSLLMCVKAGIEKNPEILNNNRMVILTNCWTKMSDDLSMISSKSYLAAIFILLGCQGLIPDELFVAAIQSFPMEIKRITKEVCHMFLNYFQDFNGKNPIVANEVVLAIIRLLSAGMLVRFTHKLEREEVFAMASLAMSLAAALQIDLNQAVEKCFPESPRKQATVILRFFQKKT